MLPCRRGVQLPQSGFRQLEQSFISLPSSHFTGGKKLKLLAWFLFDLQKQCVLSGEFALHPTPEVQGEEL